MKHTLAFIVSLAMLLGAVSCGKPAGTELKGITQTAESSESTSAPASIPGSDEEATSAADNSDLVLTPAEGRVLVVYFSATGNTEKVAGYIAQAAGGDLFELEPVTPYTDENLNYNDDSSRVVYEHEHPKAQDIELVADTVDNWDEYDTVFIGYPIWWHAAAWPVSRFMTANDFTGKTVIPFCTSASSGLEDSGTLLEELAGSGNWLEGMRFRSGALQEDVQNWVENLEV